MRNLILGDLHGSVPEIHLRGFDAIIATGDFCPADKTRKYAFRLIKERMKNPESKKNWYDISGKRKARALVKEYMERGRNVLEHLNSIGVPVYVIPGNADFMPRNYEWKYLKQNHFKELKKGLKNVLDVDHKLVDIGDYQIIGYGVSSGPEKPQYKEDLESMRKEDIKKKEAKYKIESHKLSFLFKKATKPVIFLSHNVPFNTPIDKITNKKSPRYGYHYGSLIAREMIEKYKPLVCIGGHMHEHFDKCKIGKTICINAGFGPKLNILMDLKENKINKLEFYKWK